MTRDPLGEALRSLPRERAGDDFTPRLMARLAAEERAARSSRAGRRPSWRAVAAAATLVGLLAAGGAILSRFAARPEAEAFRAPAAATTQAPDRSREAAARRARLEHLEAERARLVAELQELKRMAGDGEPVIYLGGDDQVDLVVDVGRLARRERTGETGRVEPAAYRRPDGP